jgi:lipopolysaccharide biosynthesis glycosyltransferase
MNLEPDMRSAVFICADRRMLIPSLFVAHSVVRMRERESANYDVLLVIAPTDLDDTHRRWIAENGIRLIEDLDISSISSTPIRDARLSVAALYRLLVPGRLRGQYQRLIYLDADVEVRGPLGPLFSLDLGDFSLGASRAPGLPAMMASRGDLQRQLEPLEALGMTPPYDYFNSGVLLIDPDTWVDHDIDGRSLTFLENNIQICPILDESALNALLDGRYAHLSPLWNFRAWTFDVPGVQKFVDPAIVHFDGPIKPWNRFGAGYRLFLYAREYQSYRNFLQKTPWRAWLGEQWGLVDLARSIEFEVSIVVKRLLGKRSWRQYSAAEQQAIEKDFARYCLTEPFADVEQGMVSREGGVLRQAKTTGATPSGEEAA